jgi:cytochrome c oxidase subunit III
MGNQIAEAEKPSHLQHHFVDSDQQFESSKFGMWIFLVTEVLMFGGLFVAYIIYRAWHPDLFYLAAKELDTALGATNTVVLIASSLTIALAIRAVQLDKIKAAINYMAATVCPGRHLHGDQVLRVRRQVRQGDLSLVPAIPMTA